MGRDIKSQGHHTQIHTYSHTKKHTNTQSNRETHNITHKNNTPTQTLRTQTMAMYVKHPKHHFGYHSVSNPKTNNQNLRLSKNQNSKDKRIPTGPPKGPVGGQAACKHPGDSQVGAHNT